LEDQAKHIDLYDFIHDPEELDDLTDSHRETVEALLAELQSVISIANRPYL
jgi:hypothetical protein